MDPLFGAALAAHLEAGWERMGRPDPFDLHEFGAGSGALASGLLHELRARHSPLLDVIRYRPLEADPAREAAILRRLEAEGFGPERVQRDDDAPITGVVVANELLDALPVHRLTVVDGEVRELYTTWRDGWFADEPGPPSDPRPGGDPGGLRHRAARWRPSGGLARRAGVDPAGRGGPGARLAAADRLRRPRRGALGRARTRRACCAPIGRTMPAPTRTGRSASRT